MQITSFALAKSPFAKGLFARGYFKQVTQNSSDKDFVLDIKSANLVILCLFVSNMVWVKMATQHGPIFSHSWGVKWLQRSDVAIKMDHFSPSENQNFPPFIQVSPSLCLFQPPYMGPFLPWLLGLKQLYYKSAKLDPKIVLFFTHLSLKWNHCTVRKANLRSLYISAHSIFFFIGNTIKGKPCVWGLVIMSSRKNIDQTILYNSKWLHFIAIFRRNWSHYENALSLASKMDHGESAGEIPGRGKGQLFETSLQAPLL